MKIPGLSKGGETSVIFKRILVVVTGKGMGRQVVQNKNKMGSVHDHNKTETLGSSNHCSKHPYKKPNQNQSMNFNTDFRFPFTLVLSQDSIFRM